MALLLSMSIGWRRAQGHMRFYRSAVLFVPRRCFSFTCHVGWIVTSTHLHTAQVLKTWSNKKRLQLLDTRALGKPSAPSGQEQDLSRWCFAFASFAGPSGRNLQTVMERAAEMETELARLSTYSQVASLQSCLRFAIKVVPSTS